MKEGKDTTENDVPSDEYPTEEDQWDRIVMVLLVWVCLACTLGLIVVSI